MSTLAWIVGFSVLGSVGAVGGAGLVLLFPQRARARWVPLLVSYATGTLLGAAFLGMLPAALARAQAHAVTATTLAGVVLFFVLEKLVLWRHCHQQDCPEHGRAGPLLLLGDAVHNFVDGVVVAAAFLTSVPLGVAASLAVLAHEVPQEVGDFAILLDSGYSGKKALGLNTLSALATLPGGLVGWLWLEGATGLLPYLLAIAAASFLYIAAADLIPGLHRQVAPRTSALQVLLMLLGIGTIAAFHHGG